ncbi:DnaJ domain-containing protein [Lentinula raphanica]|uniref:DnaJ domain-containing protein n=1 Tax=Lentinula raphanica TaxID=153919 RepID=A0AA38UCZ4_9AGAR|nr:DnaJ domain-containing protein [Lentinula raphanica]KAJ3827193.1 DnaJ domain-containing protein [Lentinula raphanica]KAJ3836865.1 DnaJ domain-containing protein [Lentinula raphanica]KAJ3969937.1 DnaJ domain-containing protein [Lentinula raphanica]
MATIQTNVLPKSYTLPSISNASIAGPSTRRLLPVGRALVSHLRLTIHHGHSFEAHDAHLEKERQKLEELQNSSGNGDDDLGVGDEPESAELLALDPKEWKKHDYYAVLGLSHLRYKATAEQIKIAHRKKVLKHHPDKKVTSTAPQSTSSLLSGVNLNTNDDAFFKCISKAHEVLTHPEKRRQYDSVDHELMDSQEDDPTPTTFSKSKKGLTDQEFFKTFNPIFERESRFSRKQPVPMLGDIDSSKEHVEGFYDFWYNFDSWRSFEWLDKEINEGSDNRDDKRYTEKKNKTERARRKKEDIARLRQLVDLTLSLDPRIKRIKQQEKEAREAKKAAKSAPASGAVTPQKSKAQEEAEKAKKEEEEKAAKADAKKAKAAAANAAKKARRAARAAEEGGAAS